MMILKNSLIKFQNLYERSQFFSPIANNKVSCGIKLYFQSLDYLEVVSKSQINQVHKQINLSLYFPHAFRKFALGNAVDKKSVNKLFISVTQKFIEKGEKVQNVLIFYFDMYGKIKSHLNSQNKKNTFHFVKKFKKVSQIIKMFNFIFKNQSSECGSKMMENRIR